MGIANVNFPDGAKSDMSSMYELIGCQSREGHMRFALWVVLHIVLLIVLLTGGCFHIYTEIYLLDSDCTIQ